MAKPIKLPRAHKKRLKAFGSLPDVNRWGSDVDARIDEIIHCLENTQRALTEIDRATTASALGLHAATHLPNGSDPLATGAPSSILGGTSSNSTGVANTFARSDHSHDVATAVPAFVFGTAASEGSSNSLARVDAGIAIFDVTSPADLGNAAATGSAAFAARRDHVHRSYAVRKNSTGSDFVRKRLNLIEGTNVTLTVADDAGSDEVDVTIDATGAGGAPTDAEYVVAVAHAGLSAERVATDTATVDVDAGTAAQMKWNVIESGLTLSNLGGTLSIAKGGTGQTSATNAFAALSPANTKGDLIGHTGAVQDRLPVGTNGKILRADSTATDGLAWGNASFNENIFEIFDNLDNTKILQFNPGTITTGNTRTMNIPDANGTLALLNGQLGATAAVTDVRGIRTTTGPTLLTIGAIADGQFLQRSGATVVGGAGGDSITVNGVAVVDADFDDATPAAPGGSVNVKWQKDASSPANISAYLDGATALGNNARVTVRKNTGADVGTRRRLNLIEGSNVTLTIADDAGSEEVDITIAAASGLSLGLAEATALGMNLN
jgi:hypothetical protein